MSRRELVTSTFIGIGAIISVFFPLFGVMVSYVGALAPLVILLLGFVMFLTASAYVELVTTKPDAGGGYIWIHRYLGEKQGFFAGWFSWLAHSVACAAYAIAAGEAFRLLIVRIFGQDFGSTSRIGFAIVAIALFTAVNFRGVKSTGAWGNVITSIAVGSLLVFIAGGIRAIIQHPQGLFENFSAAPPTGSLEGLGFFGIFAGLFAAMGIFYLAYTGTEIVVQESEEMENPRKTLPRSIFLSFFIVEILYLLVAIVAIGGIHEPGVPSWKVLADAGEGALVEAGRRFMPYGDLVVIWGWLVATLAALNTTIFSSAHVSFAMSRNLDLPKWLAPFTQKTGELHTRRTVILSAILITIFATALPLKDIASAASIVFILLFLQVHLTLVAKRKKEPLDPAAFRVPFYPYSQIIAIAAYLFLLIRFLPLPLFPPISPLGLGAVILWGIGGIFIYKAVTEPQILEHLEEETPFKEVLHFGPQGEKKILMPFTDSHDVAWRPLMRIAISLAKETRCDLIVLRINDDIYRGETRRQARTRIQPRWNSFRDDAVRIAEEMSVPHGLEIRYEIHHNPAEAILEAVKVLGGNYLVLGWKGYAETQGRVFGKTLDRILHEARCNLIVVKLVDLEHMQRILLPSIAGPHSKLAGRVATALAKEYSGKITVLRVFGANGESNRRKLMGDAVDALQLPETIETEKLERIDDSITRSILEASEAYDTVVMPAGRERLFTDIFVGSTAKAIMQQSKKTAILVKHYKDFQEPLEYWLTRMRKVITSD